MPSEKSRYLRSGPEPVIEMDELRSHLEFAPQHHLIDIIWHNAQSSLTLWKGLNAYIGIIESKGNLEKAKKAIDYAFHFTAPISYNERGYDDIIWQVTKALELLFESGSKDFSITLAAYSLKKARNIQELFDDDWDWTCAMDSLENWISDKTASTT